MTPTSDERREVAEQLRKHNGHYYEELVNMSDSDLADLIDPTCHLVETIKDEWPDGSATYLHRLSCGHMYETIHRSAPVFCPYCGARVVSGDD